MKNLLLIFLLLLCSCSPLKQVQRSEKIDSVAIDKSVAQQHIESTYRGEGVLTQTVVEFYHPIDAALSTERPQVPTTADSLKQPIKRIIVTKIEAKAEAKQIKDSTFQTDRETATTKDIAEKVVEKPPAAVQWIKWVVISLGIILLIIIAIKIF